MADERISELIWRGDNRSAIKALEGMAKQSRETTDTLKGDADEQSSSFTKVKDSSERLRGAMMGLMGMVGISGVAFGLKDLVEGGMALQSSQAQLQAALRATGQAAGGAQARLQAMAEHMSTSGGFATTQNLSALTAFVRETHSATQAQSMLSLATNIARGRNMDLASAQQIVQRAYTGTVGKLQALLGPMVAAKEAQVGLTTAHQQQIATLENEAAMMGKMGQVWLREQEVNDHITAQQAALATMTDKHATATMVLNAATREFAGSTAAYADTTAGKVTALKQSFQNLVENLGKALLPTMDKIVAVGSAVAEWMTRNKTAVMLVVGAVTALGVAYGGLKVIQGITDMVLALGKAFGIVSAAQTDAAVTGEASAAGLTVAWDTFMTATIIGAVVVGLVEMVEHWRTVEHVATDVWKAVSGAVTTAWHAIEGAVETGVNWVWSKLKWLGEQAKKLIADTPIGGILGFGSNLLSGHVGRAFGDAVQGATFGAVNPNAGTIGLPGNNVTGVGTIHIAPAETTLRIDGREVGRAVVRYALNTAARGPTSYSGGSLVTGAPGLPVGS